MLFGGTPDKPTIGIWLDLDAPEQFDEYVDEVMTQQPWVGLMQESSCPYCRGMLNPRPKAKKKCRACGNFVYVRSFGNRNKRFSFLVTAE